MNRPLFYCSLAFSSVCGASMYKHHDWKDPATNLVAFMTGSTLLVSGLAFFKKIK
jgi:hypothetical protein